MSLAKKGRARPQACHSAQVEAALVKAIPFLRAIWTFVARVCAAGLEQVDGEKVGAHIVSTHVGEVHHVFRHAVGDARLGLL